MIVNSLIQENPDVIIQVIDSYGAQAVVACVDFKKPLIGSKSPYSYIGHKIKYNLLDYSAYLSETLGVGEIMLHSVDKDGTWEGYDFEIIEALVNNVDVPVIACGGCGNIEHLKKVLYTSNVQAAAVGSMAVYSKKGMGVLINFPSREQVIVEQ